VKGSLLPDRTGDSARDYPHGASRPPHQNRSSEEDSLDLTGRHLHERKFGGFVAAIRLVMLAIAILPLVLVVLPAVREIARDKFSRFPYLT
jgi:hypothetical protein